MNEFLFVYGTLLSGIKNNFSKLLKTDSAYIGKASFQGKLFIIEYYPGLLNH